MKITIQKISFKAHCSKPNVWFVIVCSVLVSVFSSQLHAQSLAERFLLSQQDTVKRNVVYLSFTDSIYHTNLNGDMLKVKDSILLAMYRQRLSSTLAFLGLKVVVVNPSEIAKYASLTDSQHHTLQVAQLEIEQFSQWDTIFYQPDPSHFFAKEIGGVRFSAWLIYDEANPSSTLTFYSDEGRIDYFSGVIVPENGYKVHYDYKGVNPNDAYQTAFTLGETSGQYFFNFLMNKYVWDNTKDKSKIAKYYSIDPETKEILWAKEPFDNFDIINQSAK